MSNRSISSFVTTLRLLLVAALICIVHAPRAQTVAQPAEPTRDHVLLVTIDDLNDWVGCMTTRDGRGHPQAQTPHMDRLVERGVLFTNAHCQAPICRPSRNSLFSGLRPTTTGVYGNRGQYNANGPLTAGKDTPWMTRRFEAQGYDIYTAGKLLHAGRNKPLGGTPTPFRTTQGPYPPNKLNVPKHITPNGIWDFGIYPEPERYTDRRIAEWTAGHIKKPMKPGDKPRFLALGFYNPHVPLFAPKQYFDTAPSKQDVVLGPTREDDFEDLPEIAKRVSSRVAYTQCARWCLEDEQNLRGLTQAYLACVTAMDDQLGLVLEALDQSDLADNTWIVVLSDHGWHLGEKSHIAKQTLWTHSTRVPLIIVPPKRLKDMPRGVRCDRPAELLDVYPTLIDGAQLQPADTDARLEGLSLLPWLKDPDAPRDRPALTTLYAHNHSLVGDRYRYTRYADGSEELYDHQADPLEFDNLIDQVEDNPQLQAVVDRLSAHIPENEPRKPDLIDDRVKQ